MSVHRLTPAEKAKRRRGQALAKIRSCGLALDHVALVFAIAFLRGARSADTAMTYANGLCRWFGYCVANGIDPYLATRTDARAYAATLPDAGLKPSSQATCCAAPRTFYEEAIAERKLQFNPFKRVGPAESGPVDRRLHSLWTRSATPCGSVPPSWLAPAPTSCGTATSPCCIWASGSGSVDPSTRT